MSEDRHARTSGSGQEPLYDVTIPTPSMRNGLAPWLRRSRPERCARSRWSRRVPYGSFVTVAFDDGNPVFLVSALAEHTRNLERDRRASLLVAESGASDPLANGRVTLLGPCTRVGDDAGSARAAFLAVHPNAAYYADFSDFGFWKLRVQGIRYIGGYGRMSWVTDGDWLAAEPDPLAPSAAGVIAHMNADHSDALVLYCKAFSKATDVTGATMTGVDRYGFEMSARTGEGPRPVRVAFPGQVATAQEVRASLIAMLEDARARLGGPAI